MKNNVTIALNVLYAKKGKVYPASVSKLKSNRQKQVILLIIFCENKDFCNVIMPSEDNKI